MLRIPTWIVAVLMTVLAVVATWPVVLQMSTGVSDFGDPLLNAWILGWDAHALVTGPRHLFDANIFHPETWTLAYSETLLLPALLTAPVLWLGGSGVLAHNLVMLLGYVLSGLGMFWLVRRLTADDGAALVGGVVYAMYPYRMEAYAKIQLGQSWLWPIALLALHDLLRRPGWRPATRLALALGAECYACVYYGIFGGIGIGVVALMGLWRAGAMRAAALRGLAVAVMGAAIVAAPLALAYGRASRVVGERGINEVRVFSATTRDYLRPHPESWLYGDYDHPGEAERRLFPGYVAPILAVGSLVPPIAPAAAAYLAAGLVTADLSLGVNAPGYEWLYRHVAPIRALRVPARLAMFVGLALAVLAGFGIARACRGRSLAVQTVIVVMACLAVTAEGRMQPQTLVALEPHPSVYAWLKAQPDGVVCEYPVGNLEGRAGPQDPTYMYYSLQHWKPLVNGYSGFAPPSYGSLLADLRGFPNDGAIAALRRRNVRYLLVHQPFYINGDYAADVLALRRRSDLQWAGRFRWQTGETSDAFLVMP
jgi:hypothetical protein